MCRDSFGNFGPDSKVRNDFNASQTYTEDEGI